MRNVWKSGIMGVIVGDALGCPVQFESREKIATHPVTGMRGHGTFDLPAGSWTDDSSLTMALLESLVRKREVDLNDIMNNFMKWLFDGEFTPFGYSFDIGGGTMNAIHRYRRNPDPYACGGNQPSNNGNGSLMRIMPACIFCVWKQRAEGMTDEKAIEIIHRVGSLTHAHLRANVACGLYYFIVRELIEGKEPMKGCIRKGLDKGFAFYGNGSESKEERAYYDRLRDIDAFASLDASAIKGSGYVVEALEAALWSLLQEASFEGALLTAVNLGDDTDTVAAIAGGLAGLYFGVEEIPDEWIQVIQRREWIEELCDLADAELGVL